MNLHKNAKLTPVGRDLMGNRLLSGESFQDVAEVTGVTVPTVYKWLERWKVEREARLEDRSSRPHRSPKRLSRHRRRQIK